MEKIYKGMPNGAEAVDGNFTELDDSVVHKKGDEIISGDKKFTDSVIVKDMQATHVVKKRIPFYNGSGSITFVRVGAMVQVTVGAVPSVPANTEIKDSIPVGFRPADSYLAGAKTGKIIYFYPDGRIGDGTVAIGSGEGYFSFSYPTADDIPVE